MPLFKRQQQLRKIARKWENRLAQLEEHMKLVLEKTRSNTERQAETPNSCSSGNRASMTTPPVADSTHAIAGLSSLLPGKEVIQEVIGLYFHYCHRHPVWLFDRTEVLELENSRDEVIFGILALALRYSKHAFFAGRSEQLSQSYCDACRTNIMLRIANGTVDLSTIQSLCLLAFANFVAKDTHLAWFHINLASNLSRCAGLEAEQNWPGSTPAAEARRRAFWSIHLLQQIHGQGSRTLVILEDIANPRYLGVRKDPERQMRVTPPFTPEEDSAHDQDKSSAIWIYVVQLANLWREVRGHVSHCADGNNKSPWSPDSGYSIISAHLMDLETSFPTCHRWDSARFGERSQQDLQQNRDYWGPWLFIQFTHHAIHSMLNHPFLCSARPKIAPNLAIPNTFWKTSLDLALLHATWIVRIIDMVSEKTFEVSDPFLGHCAAIAATVHLYYCRAAVVGVRQLAQNNLAKCIKFVDDLGAMWPVCQTISEKLDKLTQIAFGSSLEEPPTRTILINTALMWDVLDYACPRESEQQPGRGLFHMSLRQNLREEATKDHTVETHVFHKPSAEINTMDGGQVAPPNSDPAGEASVVIANRRAEQLVVVGSTQEHLEQQPEQTTLWLGHGFMEAGPFVNIAYDPFSQFYEQSSPAMGMWEEGNL